MSSRSSLPVKSESDTFKIAELFKTQFKIDSPLWPSKDPHKLEQLNLKSFTRFMASEVAAKGVTREKSPGHDLLSIEHLQHAVFI